MVHCVGIGIKRLGSNTRATFCVSSFFVLSVDNIFLKAKKENICQEKQRYKQELGIKVSKLNSP